jgi:hypothetical protein
MSGSITAGLGNIPFLVSGSDEGFFSDSGIIQEEELNTSGVDGVRWRTVFRQFPDFELRTVTQATTLAEAIAFKRLAERAMVGKNAKLTVTIAGTSYSMKDVHVKAAKGTVVPGPLYGAGVTTANAHIIIQWMLRGTDFDSQ